MRPRLDSNGPYQVTPPRGRQQRARCPNIIRIRNEKKKEYEWPNETDLRTKIENHTKKERRNDFLWKYKQGNETCKEWMAENRNEINTDRRKVILTCTLFYAAFFIHALFEKPLKTDCRKNWINFLAPKVWLRNECHKRTIMRIPRTRKKWFNDNLSLWVQVFSSVTEKIPAIIF